MTGTIVYPGVFDPFTLGHLNIVERACGIFDKITVAVAHDSPKNPLFSLKERREIIEEVFKDRPEVEVDDFSGLLVNYLNKKEESLLLRGIRTVSDFEYEYQMALANKVVDQNVETFFMMTEGQYSYLSSTVIKEIARLGGDVAKMLPKIVERRVREKMLDQ